MQTFIDIFIRELLSEKRDFSSSCVIFPSRRAGTIFKKKFADTVEQPTWLPAVFSIDDFIAALSPLQVAEATHLLMELYTVYKKYFPLTGFEKYLSWGELMLRDFNETDLQLVHAENLFSEVFSLKEMSAQIGIGEEEAQRIRDFWKLFSKQELSGLQNEFLNNWRTLPVIYHEFREQLKSKGLSYSGMASKLVVQGLQDGSIPFPWKTAYFAGFYALSNAEKAIINHLIKLEIAVIRWDADRYYTEDKRQEAGKYFRKKQLDIRESSSKWTFDCFSQPKKITFIGVPLQVGQARYTGILLKQMQQEISSADHTAIVLPDEKLLMPLLYSLPEETESINITMGFPLRGSPVDQLVRDLKTIHDFYLHKNEQHYFRTMDLISLFENIYLRPLQDEITENTLKRHVKEKRLYLSGESLEEFVLHEQVKQLLDITLYQNGVLAYLTTVIQNLLIHYQKEKSSINNLYLGLLKFFFRELEKLNRLASSYKEFISFEDTAVWRLITDLLHTLRVPFTGEPVKGLQVMGFLETRNLDFKNLFILSMNEDVMPGNSTGNSYIPYAIRKAYSLPTYEEQDAIYAYHFYRLLQRSENVFLLYNTEAGGLSGGEMSRYLLQLAHEMKRKAGEQIHISHYHVGTDLLLHDIRPITIIKNEAVMQDLQNLFISTGENPTALSATAFSTYLSCSLRFYFRYVAGIREPDEIKTEIDSAVFGTIVHAVMENFYAGQETITRSYLDTLSGQIEKSVEKAIRKEVPSGPGPLTGKNRLLLTVMTDLIGKLLIQDKSETPFSIVSLEKEYIRELQTGHVSVKIKGKIDRIDSTKGQIRIIDYKTGLDKKTGTISMDDVFSGTDQKATFQLLLYCWLYAQDHPGSSVKAGLFKLRSINQGIDFINEGNPVMAEQLLEFETKLTDLVQQILNPEIAFRQTEEEKTCVYCPYKDICNRG